MASHGTFEEELNVLAADLRRLRIDRGNPSYRKLEARAAKSRTGIRLPVATQSDAFRGKRLLGLDTLMALVRILHSFDEYGRETAVPPHNSPDLGVWRARWRALAALQPPAPDRVRQPAPATPALAPTALGASGFALAHVLTARLRGNWGAVFSPDGRLLATTARDGVVQLWDPVNGRAVGEIDVPSGPVLAMTFSPDGRLLATGGVGGAARLWHTTTFTPAGSPLLGHDDPVRAVAFSPDGRVLATAGDDETVRRWDAATGEPVGDPLIGHFGEVGALAFRRDGGLMTAVKGKHAVRLWDLPTGASVGEPLTGHGSEALGIVFSPDGRLLALGGEDGARLWDTATGAAVGGALRGPDPFVRGLAFSPDGRLLATGGDDEGTVLLWDVSTGAPIGPPLTGLDMAAHSIAFSSDGRFLAACGESGTVVIHHRDAAAAGSGPSLGTRAVAAALQQGSAIALPPVSADNGVLLRRLAFSPDGSRLLVRTGDHRILAWDPETREPLAESLLLPSGTPWGLEFPDEAGPAELWTPAAVRNRPLSRPVALYQQVAFAADRRLAIIGGAGGVLFWDVVDGAQATSGAPDGMSDVFAVAASPDGSLLAAVVHEKLVLWDPAAPASSGLELDAHRHGISTVAFSPDGRLLATGDIGGAIRLWDPAAPSAGVPLAGHTGQVCDLAFSPDGRLLASAGADGTVHLWDPALGESAAGQLPLTGHVGPVRGVAFSPDGSLLAAAGDDGTLRFWALPGPGTGVARSR
ncbi:WD40 repeat domain-containing protein [Streptomyces sp. NPDC051211]|uniref:WD40 repeat domain-containing protein n=1 Tax=Streptomyces sp. NPDC051211 TaxID=3154643 RepID=UPI00344E0A8A